MKINNLNQVLFTAYVVLNLKKNNSNFKPETYIKSPEIKTTV